MCERICAPVFLVAAFALAGCGGSGGGAGKTGDGVDVEVATETASATVESPAQGSAVVLWRFDESAGKIVSTMVGDNGVVIAERPERIAVVGSTLVAIRDLADNAELCACDSNPAVLRKVVIERPAVVSLATGQALHYFSTPVGQDTCDPGMAEIERGVATAGLLGEFVFGTVEEYGMGCVAAHPYWSSMPFVLDLKSHNAIKASPRPEVGERLGNQARTKILAESGDCVFDPDKPAALFSFSPIFRQNGSIATRYTFTMDAPYVCGTGPGHYTVADEVEHPEAPPGIPHFEIPRFALPEIQKGNVMGVSAVVPSETVATALKLFKSAPVPTPIRPR